VHERAESRARKTQETGGVGLLTQVPTAGEMAHRAGDGLRAYKEPPGSEPNFRFLQAPRSVQSLLRKKPARRAALGLVFWLALLLGRLVERALRVHVETTGQPRTGGDKKATQPPTAFLRMTKFAGGLVSTVGDPRQLAPPRSPVHPHDLVALRVPATYFTPLQRGYPGEEVQSRSDTCPGGQRWRGQSKAEGP
jgi:hypothetical protein